MIPSPSPAYPTMFGWVGGKLPAGSDGMPYDNFGENVSISGNFALIGAVNFPYPNLSKAYLYQRTGSGWVEQIKLTGDDGLLFGWAVSLSGTYAMVGAPEYALVQNKVFIYHFDGAAWTLAQKITASDDFSWFGQAVSISGDFAIVGAIGQAYIFQNTGGQWTEQTILTAGNDPPRGFGASVSISGNYAIVGVNDAMSPVASPASAYVFFFNGTDWQLQAKLSPGPGIQGGTRQAVSISGDYAIVGEVTATFSNTYEGRAYIYHRVGTQWNLLPALQGVPGPQTRFGWSVSIGSDHAVIGDPFDAADFGAAYVYAYDGTKLAKIKGGGVVAKDRFGLSVSTDGAKILVGAPYQTIGGHYAQGAAYSYVYVPFPKFAQLLISKSFAVLPDDMCVAYPMFCVSGDQWSALSLAEQQLILGVRLHQLASMVTDEELRQKLQLAASGLMQIIRSRGSGAEGRE